MSKFRAAIISVTLAAMFFIPFSAIPKTETLPLEEKPPVSENSSSSSEEEFRETETDLPEGYFYHTTAGYEWDAPVEDLWFTSDGQGGAFKITARYFMEASEGHGIRFAAMVDTFEVIAKNK